MYIKNIKAIRVLDSRGVPTIKTFVRTENNLSSFSVPSGTSSGYNEALELRDKNSKDYFNQDVKKAIKNVNTKINNLLKDEFILNQERIDYKMIEKDGTENKSNLGANAILSTSVAVLKAASKELNLNYHSYISKLYETKQKFSKPILNIINGGEHAGNKLDFQEFQIIPQKKKISKNIQISSEIYHNLKQIIVKKYGAKSTNVGYEGGFVPFISDPKKALDLIVEAIDVSNYSKDVKLGLDCAANSFYLKSKDKYKFNSKEYNRDKLIDYYLDLIEKYNFESIEDPFSELDKESWKDFYLQANKKINIIGDDLLVTNPKLIKQAIDNKYCDSLLLKINQIGTLTESVEAYNLAKKHNWKTIVSHRSGETEDNFISDLSYGLGSDYTKFGAPSRSERTSKYNRLLEIENFF